MEDEKILNEENAEPAEEAAESTADDVVETVEGELAPADTQDEEKKAKGRKKTIGIAATVGTIALGAIAIAAYKIFKRKK